MNTRTVTQFENVNTVTNVAVDILAAAALNATGISALEIEWISRTDQNGLVAKIDLTDHILHRTIRVISVSQIAMVKYVHMTASVNMDNAVPVIDATIKHALVQVAKM